MSSSTTGYGCLLTALLMASQAIAADKPLADLQGKWRVTKSTLNGKEIQDRQITKAELEFTGDDLAMNPGDGSTRERFKIKPDADAKPAAIQVTRIEPANRPQQGWQIYEIKDRRLRMAFFDAMRERPKSFDPQPKLIVLELEKIDEGKVR